MKALIVLLLSASAFGQCDASLWKHIYHKPRLHVIKACTTVTGTIDRACRKEKDGDWHCFLKLDKQFEFMLNDGNIKKQFGDLVIEPICVKSPTQTDAISSCKGFAQKFPEIVPGNRVAVTGAYVLDTAHQHREIHPISKIRRLP